MKHCPECHAEFEDAYAACPRCREVLSAGAPPKPGSGPTVVQRVPDAAAGALLCGVLEHHGIHALLRSATLPAYGSIPRDWSTTAWGEILTPAEEAEEARAIIVEYLQALEGGGRVRDEDVEGTEPSEDLR